MQSFEKKAPRKKAHIKCFFGKEFFNSLFYIFFTKKQGNEKKLYRI